MRDYYYILGIEQNVTVEQIKSVYRKLSKKFHPDMNNGDKFFEERFIAIQEAYEILSDYSKRQVYDKKLASFQHPNFVALRKYEEELKRKFEKEFARREEEIRQKYRTPEQKAAEEQEKRRNEQEKRRNEEERLKKLERDRITNEIEDKKNNLSHRETELKSLRQRTVQIEREINFLKSQIISFKQKLNNLSIGKVYDKMLNLERNESTYKWGFVGRSGDIIIPFLYDGAEEFNQGFALVHKNDKYGFINEKGEITINLQFEFAESFSQGLAVVRINRKFGFINKQGNLIIHTKFDSADTFANGRARVNVGRTVFYIDKNGNRI